MDRVIVDTNVWASFFSKPSSTEKKAVSALLDEDRIDILCSIVVEVLVGVRKKSQADWVASKLRSADLIALTWNESRFAADIGRELRANGHSLPVTDLEIAAIAKRRDLRVYTNDPHFDLVPDLKRFDPEE